jgi:hypothetical protein
VCTATFTAMWLAGTSTREIAESLGIGADRCDVTRRKLGLPSRKSWHGGTRKAYLPTPEEIRAKCLEFQAGWSDEERAKRRVPPEVQVEAPVYSDDIFLEAELQGDGG